MSIRIEVTEWPDGTAFDPDNPRWQWDLYEDGEWIAGGTGPSDAIGHAYYAIEAYQKYRQEEAN